MGPSRWFVLLLSCTSLNLVSGPRPMDFARAEGPSVSSRVLEGEVAVLAAQLGGRSAGLLPWEIERVARTIAVEGRRAGLPPHLVLAVIDVESGGDAFAVSRAGAMGLMQLLPATARAEARRRGVAWRGPQTLFDPVTNVRLGIGYLERLVRRYKSLEIALAAYNWGPSRISARVREGEPVPAGYRNRVLASYRDSRTEGGQRG